MEKIPCCQCGEYFIPDPRQKDQRYCSKKACQRARKAAWQRKKMKSDPDYQQSGLRTVGKNLRQDHSRHGYR